MTTLSESEKPRSGTNGSRLRVMLLLEIHKDAQQRFLKAYEQLRHQVAGVPGHIRDQLCQSIEDPSQWLITSEWDSAPQFLAWVNSAEHVRMVEPLHACALDTRSLRYTVLRETPESEPADRAANGSNGSNGSKTAAKGAKRAKAAKRSAPADGRPGGRRHGASKAAPRPGPDGAARHALTFTVKPGSERAVAEILADYAPPAAQVDADTRLSRTSLFMRGDRVVRAVEVIGDLGAALRHVATQPGIRAAEEALNPHLVEDRDLDDPQSARAFFARAALPAVHHLAVDGAHSADPSQTVRRALLYPARPGCGASVARLLARQDESAVADRPDALAGSTIYHRDDIVVRVIDLCAPFEQEPALVAGIAGRRAPAVLSRLIDLGTHDLTSGEGIGRFVADCEMALVTDRRAADD